MDAYENHRPNGSPRDLNQSEPLRINWAYGSHGCTWTCSVYLSLYIADNHCSKGDPHLPVHLMH